LYKTLLFVTKMRWARPRFLQPAPSLP